MSQISPKLSKMLQWRWNCFRNLFLKYFCFLFLKYFLFLTYSSNKLVTNGYISCNISQNISRSKLGSKLASIFRISWIIHLWSNFAVEEFWFSAPLGCVGTAVVILQALQTFSFWVARYLFCLSQYSVRSVKRFLWC